jgi:hypothetical protein
MFEAGDQVVYMPHASNLLPVSQRPWDIGTVVDMEDMYIKVKFLNDYQSYILPIGLIHHPHSPKAIRQQMQAVLPEIVATVESRVAALVFSEKTGQTGKRGLGPADILRSFLEPRISRKDRDNQSKL